MYYVRLDDLAKCKTNAKVVANVLAATLALASH